VFTARRGVSLASALIVAVGALFVAATPAQAAASTLTFDTYPAAPWHVERVGAATASQRNGSILIQTARNQAFSFVDTAASDIWAQAADNDLGWIVTARLRLEPDTLSTCDDGGGPASVFADDGTQRVHLAIGKDRVCLANTGVTPVAVDTTSGFHDYQLDVKGQHVFVRVDGAVVMDAVVPRVSDGTVRLAFGHLTGQPATTEWDSFSYDPTAGCTIMGTPGADTIQGTDSADTICALGGDDVVDAHKGDDRVYGGPGRDSLRGAVGADRLAGGFGPDVLIGDTGDDVLLGGPGDDTFRAAAVADGGDRMIGDTGWDTVSYSARSTRVVVTVDGDTVRNDGAVAEGDDVALDVERVIGGSGPDDLTHRGLGPSTLFGGPGDDRLDTRDAVESADDRIDGGAGTDTCLGESGATLVSCP
jgi:Ca2+-binding RTX toxin-like protein